MLLYAVYKVDIIKIIYVLSIMIKIKQNVLTLKGITLRGSLQLYNPNQNLAVIFQAQCPLDFQLCIEPKRGIIMQNQIKIVKLWVKSEDRDRAVSANLAGKTIKITTTFKSEYNRKIFEKMNIKGWEQTKNVVQVIDIPIVISHTVSSIRSQIKNQASNSLNKYSNSREQIKFGYSINNNNNSNQMRSNPSPKLSMNKISSKLNKQLDYLFQTERSQNFDTPHSIRTNNNINFRKEVYNQYSSNNIHGEVRQMPKVDSFVGPYQAPKLNRPEIVNYYPNSGNNNQPATTMLESGKRVYSTLKPQVHQYLGPNDLGSKTKPLQFNKSASDQRFLQIIILSALAGFFAALGSNLKLLFS